VGTVTRGSVAASRRPRSPGQCGLAERSRANSSSASGATGLPHQLHPRSAVLTAAAPAAWPSTDRYAPQRNATLGITPSHAPGRYSRCTEAIDQFPADTPGPLRKWTARDFDAALYWLNHPSNSTYQQTTNLNSMQGN
jgi:hypothetical protein